MVVWWSGSGPTPAAPGSPSRSVTFRSAPCACATAAGLAGLVNVLNPDRIVLGGLYADLLRASEMQLRAGLAYRAFLDHAAAVDLRPVALAHPALVGAAELALQPLLDDPRRVAEMRSA